MNLCSYGHEEICHNERNCPLCEANDTILKRDDEIAVLNKLKEKSRTLSELMHNNSITDIGKRFVSVEDAVEIYEEAKKEGILYMAQQLFSRVDTLTWNNVIAKILDKHKIDFK